MLPVNQYVVGSKSAACHPDCGKLAVPLFGFLIIVTSGMPCSMFAKNESSSPQTHTTGSQVGLSYLGRYAARVRKKASGGTRGVNPLSHGLLYQLKNLDRMACEIAGRGPAVTSPGMMLLDFVKNTFVAVDKYLSLRGETECAQCLTSRQMCSI
jgi:hypothetical protein